MGIGAGVAGERMATAELAISAGVPVGVSTAVKAPFSPRSGSLVLKLRCSSGAPAVPAAVSSRSQVVGWGDEATGAEAGALAVGVAGSMTSWRAGSQPG